MSRLTSATRSSASRSDADRLEVRGREIDLPERGTIYVREAAGPRRSPTLVLLHGLGATAALNWDGCIPTLARRFRVLAPDHRGHGRGIRCAGRFRLEDCADDVAALIRQECRGPVLVAGYSMGGPITQLLARDHPELVAGMVLCATSRDFRGRPRDRIQFGALGVLSQVSRLAPAGPLVLPAGMRRRVLGDRYVEVAGHERFAVLSAAACLGRFTSRDWIGSVAAPAAVVLTTDDRLVPPRRQRKLAESLQAPVVELEAAHLVPHTDPDSLAQAILEAVDQLPRKSRRARRRAA